MQAKKVLIGMSGGVDSSVAALLMKQAGFVCMGATMRLYEEPDCAGSCNAPENIADAQAVAERLDIPFCVLDFQKEFAQQVIHRFIASYESGMTPNPCVECNCHMKFDRMLSSALELGCDYVVSGHYAQIHYNKETGRYLLYKAKDHTKDQTYFLAGLNQYQLEHTLFPLGSLAKQEVREIAEEHGFLNARKRDSQDICFVPDGDYAAFMARYTGKTYAPGNYLDMEGNVVGRHQGAVSYTIGQRKGLGIALGKPVYVCGKNMADNTVTLGPNEALFTNALLGLDWNWLPFPALTEPLSVTAKIRHSQKEVAAVVYPEADGSARVEFEEAQRAISPGQAVVLYQGDMVVGGGTIAKALTL